MVRRYVAVPPSAARLTGSLRDIGYDFPSAVADLVDNSITAGATTVEVDLEFAGPDSTVFIADDGAGMTPGAIAEALRFGSRRNYPRGDLGRYGLGLKTASLSQCRAVTVTSSRPHVQRISSRQLDLDLVAEWDEWIITDPGLTQTVRSARRYLERGFSTVITWEDLDRVLPESRADGGWARRRFETLAERTRAHLSMVFHRFLEGSDSGAGLVIAVNGEKLSPWNPFAPGEPATVELPARSFEVEVGSQTGEVHLRRYILPARDAFTTADGFERLSGPKKWNRQQGLYLYRAGRLVQWGGWAGIRGIDEHTKLARAALDFDTELDDAFNINVAKVRATVPTQLRQQLERSLHELCIQADDVYRRSSSQRAARDSAGTAGGPPTKGGLGQDAGIALRSAALQTGDYEALTRIAAVLRLQAPEVLDALAMTDL